MKIKYDKDADAIYIELSENEFSSNKKIDDNTIIDIDTNGNIIGIELLDVSKRLTKDYLSNITVENLTLA